VQTDLLDRYPSANIRVYAVWFSMYEGDSRARWRRELMPDRRVEHFWDEERVLGRRYYNDLARLAKRRAPGTKNLEGTVQWDAYMLYASGVKWDAGRTNVISWGRTILLTRETLQREFVKHAARNAGQ